MHDDDRRWLRHPVLPRPPALPHFGPEMRALIGLDPSDFERDAVTEEPGPHGESEELVPSGDTEQEALAAVSEVSNVSGVVGVRGEPRSVRTGT